MPLNTPQLCPVSDLFEGIRKRLARDSLKAVWAIYGEVLEFQKGCGIIKLTNLNLQDSPLRAITPLGKLSKELTLIIGGKKHTC